MPKTKISEFSATPGNNTDIDGINISEGCAPSGINDAIRELMSQLKDFQAGTAGDSFNGPVGTTTAAAGAFTTLSASGAVTLSGGTANGIPYLNGSKVLTTGSALTFDGTNFGVNGAVRSFLAADTNYRAELTNSGGATQLLAVGTGATMQLWVDGSERVRVSNNGNVGIGTSSPGTKLHVAGSAETFRISGGGTGVQYQTFNTTGGNYYLGVSSSTGTGLLGGAGAYSLCLVTESARNIHFGTNNTLQATIDSSGNLGLGVTPSAWTIRALQIGSGFAAISTGVTNARIFANTYYDNAYRYVGTGRATQYEQDGYHAWYVSASGTAGNAISFTQAMTLDASGNLGIGGTSPATKLDVYGTKTLASDLGVTNIRDTASFAAGNGGAIVLMGKYNSSGSYVGGAYVNASKENATDGNYSYALTFGTNVNGGAMTERARIDSSGRFGIGLTPSGAYNLQVSNTPGGNSGMKHLSSTTGTSYAMEFFTSDGNSRGFISYTTSGTTYNTTSDYRLKENIQPMTGALAKVAQLKPVTYTWKETGSASQGFIAHELQAVVPECVTGEKDAVDADGKPVYQGIDTSFLAGLYAAALQELMEEVNSLKAEIAALKA